MGPVFGTPGLWNTGLVIVAHRLSGARGIFPDQGLDSVSCNGSSPQLSLLPPQVWGASSGKDSASGHRSASPKCCWPSEPRTECTEDLWGHLGEQCGLSGSVPPPCPGLPPSPASYHPAGLLFIWCSPAAASLPLARHQMLLSSAYIGHCQAWSGLFPGSGNTPQMVMPQLVKTPFFLALEPGMGIK